MNELLPTIPEKLDLNLQSSEMDAICQEFGMVPIANGNMQNLRKLGIGMEELGIVKVANGYAILSMNAILTTIKKIQDMVNNNDKLKPDALKGLAHEMGYLATALSKVSKNTVETDEVAREGIEAAEKRKRKSFIPGSVVINQQFNVKPT